MSQEIDINPSGNRAGTIVINDDLDRLMAHRTAEGFYFGLPARINLKQVGSSPDWHMVRNLRGEIDMISSDRPQIEVGRWHNPWFYIGRPECSKTTSLVWTGTAQALAYINKIRDCKAPRFQIHLHGEYYRLYETSDPHSRTQGEPEEFYGQVEISYPVELWISKLRQLRLAENVLVEVPLPTSPPSPWDDVWRALIEARDSFERGGATGWKGCVTAVRLALERWRNIEKEDTGPSETRPGTKRQRLDSLRFHLLQCAHLGPHSDAEEWSRDDALLLLSTLSALLAQRKP